MKGTKDMIEEAAIALESGKALKAKQKPDDGKALARLRQFASERGLPSDLLDAAPPDGTSTRSAKAGAKTKAASKKEETGGKVESYAQALAETATEIKQPGMQSTGMRTAPDGKDVMGPPTATGPQWRFLGPTSLTNGQTYGDSRVIVSGRVSCIAVDPSNGNHVLVGSAGGGVWETYNRGANWFPRTDYMPTLTTGALAFNPSAPTTVYCGTGEGNFYAGLGAGLMRSTNGGATWSMLCTAPFVGQGFYDLLVDKANGNHLLSANSWGVYESTNGGTAWSRRRTATCWDLATSPAGGATAEILAACSDGLYRSTNGGTAYSKVTLPGSPANFDRLATAISKTNPATAYAMGANGTNVYYWRRTTAGGAWSTFTGPSDHQSKQAWYDWFLEVSGNNANEVFLGGIEAYRGTLSGTTWSWVKISNKAGDDIHPDQHCLTVDPSNANNIFSGNDGGIFFSGNKGTNWQSLNPGLGISEVEYLAQDFGNSRWLLAGTQDNGSIRYTGNAQWEHVADGDGGDCGSNRTLPDTVYHTYFGMGMDRSTAKGNWGSWGWIGPNVPNTYNALFYPPIEVNGDTVAQAGQSVFISRNRGTNFVEKTMPAGSDVGSAMYIPNVNSVFVGTGNGRIYKFIWNGTSWNNAVALTTPRAGAFVSDLFVDPNNLNRIWVTISTVGGNRVFRSDNGGSAWINCTTGLPNLPINAIEVHPSNANRIWVSADVGVYQSFDAGATWAAFANSLPNALAYDLVYHPHARVLRVALRNRGVWEIPVDGWLSNPVCAVQWNGALSPGQTQSWFTFNWPATWHMLWTVMPTTFAPGAASLQWKVKVERASAEFVTYWIEVKNLTNRTINFEGRYAILSYY